MAARTLDDLRRLVARIGSDAAARDLETAIAVAARRPARPTAAALTVPPVGRGVGTHAVAAPTARVAGGATPMAIPPTRTATVGGDLSTTVRDSPPLRPRTARAATVTTTTVEVRTAAAAAPAPVVRSVAPRMVSPLGTETAGAVAARRMRRAPVAWAHISPDRLRAAWGAILAEHGHPGADLELVGVYGPLPMDAVGSVAVGADRQAVIHLAADVRRSNSGDIALARHTPTGRLLRSAGATTTVLNPSDEGDGHRVFRNRERS